MRLPILFYDRNDDFDEIVNIYMNKLNLNEEKYVSIKKLITNQTKHMIEQHDALRKLGYISLQNKEQNIITASFSIQKEPDLECIDIIEIIITL